MFRGIFILLIVSFAAAKPTDTAKDIKDTKEFVLGNSPNFSNTCGGILHANSGTIYYKYYDTVEPNENCVWIIRAPSATTGYLGNVDNVDASSSLIISSFGYEQGANHIVPSTSYNVNGSVLVVTYTASNSTSNHGFYLTYSRTTVTGLTPANSTSEGHLVTGNSGHIKYPSGSTTYGLKETSVFVFEPFRNVHGQIQKTQVLYIQNKIEGCADRLYIWKFDRSRSGVNKWVSAGRQICNDVDSVTITNQDLILIYFQSDSGIEYEGFHLYAQSIP